MANPSTQKFTALAIFDWYNEYGPDACDGLTDEERERWDNFRAGLVDDWRRPCNHIASDNDSHHYGKCDVTGLSGDVVTFTAVWL